MINKQLIKRKVAKLTTYLKELEKLSDYEFQEYQLIVTLANLKRKIMIKQEQLHAITDLR